MKQYIDLDSAIKLARFFAGRHVEKKHILKRLDLTGAKVVECDCEKKSKK